MSQCNMTFDLKINLAHSDLYFSSFSFCSEKILVVLAKPDSGELRCPATALIHNMAHKDMFFAENLDDMTKRSGNLETRL